MFPRRPMSAGDLSSEETLKHSLLEEEPGSSPWGDKAGENGVVIPAAYTSFLTALLTPCSIHQPTIGTGGARAFHQRGWFTACVFGRSDGHCGQCNNRFVTHSNAVVSNIPRILAVVSTLQLGRTREKVRPDSVVIGPTFILDLALNLPPARGAGVPRVRTDFGRR